MEGHIIALFLVFFVFTVVLGVLAVGYGNKLRVSLKKSNADDAGTDAILLVVYSVCWILGLSVAVYLLFNIIKGFLTWWVYL